MSDQRRLRKMHDAPGTGSGTPVVMWAGDLQRDSGQISYTYQPPAMSTETKVTTTPMMTPSSTSKAARFTAAF